MYLSEDESEAIVVERYADQRSLLEHLANVGEELMEKILATAEVSGETLGRVDDDLRALIAAQGVRLFTPYALLPDESK